MAIEIKTSAATGKFLVFAPVNKVTERHLGLMSQVKTGQVDGKTVTCWVVDPNRFSRSIVEKAVAKIEADLVGVARVRPVRRGRENFRNLLGQCGACDDGACCGHCTCCS